MYARAAHETTNLQLMRSDMLSGSISGFISLPSSLLSLIALLPMSASGQRATAATPSIPTMLSRTEHTQSMTTSYMSSPVSNTTAAATSTSTPISNDILPGATNARDPTASAFRYYWLILVVFGLVIALFLWWINRRRIKRKELMRLSGRNALARDMEGWVNTRRWYHGAWRPNDIRASTRREEGFNENGEAPPPYRPKGDVTVTQDPATGLSIPLRTLSREQVDAGHPPEYHETLNRHSDDATRPAMADSGTNLHATTDSPPRSSIGDLVHVHYDRGTTAQL
ncbi:hypothetical protein DPSP01_009850 [Paraphaeosphaeria sporulosa]|uniref:Uncharacterized protein n=1 Tax=Paraphaeosphaeria sporulosa TaxID=1460663 RepID=A0A177BVG6_9PLEO|nr:uncharacterized protein CC84DRAFT_1170011 [Paraphaeosphaeria sporulosa]OAF98648.1 hypothetical protein CC84DRAFT_1170011 [Paraphaeosphaeria sporulosa]